MRRIAIDGRKHPLFRPDGYLPLGVYLSDEAEVHFRFGSPSRRRAQLILRLRQWVQLARAVAAPRLFVDGSFVTAKESPSDLDAVIWLPPDFQEQLASGSQPAIELEQMLLTRRPEEIFAAEDQQDWDEWIEFFSRTREPDGRRKGVVEVRR